MTAAGGDGCTADHLQLRRPLRDAVREHEPDGFFHAQASGHDAAIAQTLDESLERALVFLPRADIRLVTAERAQRDQFFRAVAFESGLRLGGTTLHFSGS